MDKAQLEQDVRRGEHAQRLLEDPLFIESIAAIRDDSILAFVSAAPDNERALVNARLLYDVTENFINSITKNISDAVMAHDRLGRVEH